jgi:hypothetical protein
MKKIGYFILLCFFECSVFTIVSAESEIIRTENYGYRLSDEGAFIHSYTGGKSQLTLPTEIEGYPVVGISERAFIAHPKLRSVFIPHTITHIGEGAFAGCRYLRDILVDPLNPNFTSTNGVLFDKEFKRLIQYPAGNKRLYYEVPIGTASLDPYSFIFCKNLNYILLPEGIENIGNHAFEGTSISRIELPSSLKKLGTFAFLSCDVLKSIQIVSGCEGLEAFVAPQHERSAFITQWEYDEQGALIPIKSQDIELEKLSDRKDVSLDKPKNYTAGGELLYTVINSNQVSILGYQYKDSANKGSSRKRSQKKVGKKNLVIPETLDGLPVTEIADRAFFCAFDLKNVWLPESITRVGDSAFMYCTSLSYISLPESLTHISNGAFRHCHSLEQITLGEGISHIGPYAFDGCSNLVSVVLPNSIQTLNEGVFLNCASLEKISMGDNLVSIGKFALEGCVSLKNLFVPKNLNMVGETFETCSSLESFEVHPDNEHFSSLGGVLFDKSMQSIIRFPRSNRGEQSDSSSRSKKLLLSEYSIPKGVKKISTFAFSRAYCLTNIVIPSTVNKIEPYAFYMCTNLAQVTIPDSVEAIPQGAFSRSYSLQRVTIGQGLKHIYPFAFSSCPNLSALYFKGNAPEESSNYLDDWNKVIIYRLENTTGWDSSGWIGKQLQFWWDDAPASTSNIENAAPPEPISVSETPSETVELGIENKNAAEEN